MTSRLPSAVAAALRHAEASLDALREAESLLASRKDAHARALQALHEARVEADRSLPQCDAVRVGWRTGRAEGDPVRHVIVRKTPSGQLVTRPVGGGPGREECYNASTNGVYRQVRRDELHGSVRELRNVPDEYGPDSVKRRD